MSLEVCYYCLYNIIRTAYWGIALHTAAQISREKELSAYNVSSMELLWLKLTPTIYNYYTHYPFFSYACIGVGRKNSIFNSHGSTLILAVNQIFTFDIAFL